MTSKTRKPTGKTIVRARKASAPFRASDYLKTRRDKVAYLNAAIADGEPVVLLAALRNIVDGAGGMTWLAQQTGLSRESLYKGLSLSGNPRLSSLSIILKALGLELAVKPRRAA